ncbi:MAG: TonB-dependent receptor [Pseudomonadota bacterium]
MTPSCRTSFAYAGRVIALLALGLFVNTGAVAQSTTAARPVNITGQALGDALIQLSDVYGVSILADESLVRGRTTNGVSGTLTSAEALDRLLAGTPLTARRQKNGNFVIVERAQGQIGGTVTDQSTGSPVVGARIRVLNRTTQALTDTAGQFTLGALPRGPITLRVERDGYAALIRRVTVGRAADLTLELRPSSAALPEEIVVSANRQEESLQQVPASISRIDADTINDLQLRSHRDLPTLSGNLSAADFGAGDGINFSIRGITSLTFDPSVVVYIDGINQFDIYSSIESLNDVESIEILKGPQGTVFGRNALGGVINIRTRQPTREWRANVGVTAGNYNLARVDASASGPLIDDRLLLSVSGVYSDQDGFYTNGIDGSNFNGERNQGVNAALTYRAGERWSTTLSGKHYERDVDGYVPYAVSPEAARNDPFRTFQDSVGSVVIDLNQVALQTRFNGERINVSNVLSYQTSEYEINNVDIDFTPADINTFTRPIPGADNTARVLTNELQISSPATASGIRWLAGAYLFRQELPINQSIRNGAAAAAFDPTAPNTLFNFNESENEGFALFGQITWPLSDNVELTVGARYDEETRQNTGRLEFAPDGAPPFVISPAQSREIDFDAVSPRVSLNWFAGENTNVYATYSRGNRIGGINNAIDPAFLRFDPETSDNFEVGMKGSAREGRLNYALSAFFSTRDNIQTQVFEPGVPGFNFITLSNGEGENLGLEVEADYLITDGLQVTYSLGLLDATYTRLQIPDFLTGVNQTLEDKDAIIAPTVTSNLVLEYVQPLIGLSSDAQLEANLQWSYLGEQAFDFNNVNRQAGYSLFGAQVGVRYKRLGVHLWGQNLADEEYIQWSAPIGSAVAFLGAPRTYGVRINYEF